MHITEGEILTLDNNKEFICLAVKNYKEYNYLLLLSNYKPVEIRFAKEIIIGNNIDLEIINKQEEKLELMELFKEKLSPNQ
ncbi:MAG: hypothetical protein IJN90_01150 [Bacilli bacterium]|nr:hypothetical protein [Bacilli bacterium]